MSEGDGNTLIAMALFAVAAFDALFAKCFLPKIMARRPDINPKSIRLVQLSCYMASGFFALLGLVFYFRLLTPQGQL